MISVQRVIRLKKKTNFKDTFFFGVVVGVGCVRYFEDPGREKNFCLVNTCKAGGGLLVTAFQHGLFLAEPLTHSYHNIIINSFLIIFSFTDQNARY